MARVCLAVANVGEAVSALGGRRGWLGHGARSVCAPAACVHVGVRRASTSRVAAVLDIDGVCMLGKTVIPGAPEALQRLRKQGIPTLFVTNGGGVTEQAKAEALQAKLGVPVSPAQVLLCHTPVRELVTQYGDKRVLCVGSPGSPAVAREYGFTRVATVADVIAEDPRRYPLHEHKFGDNHGTARASSSLDGHDDEFAAVMVFHDPVDWGPDMQTTVDVLRGGKPLGSGQQQAVPFYHCNPDIVYADRYEVPRFTCGAFTECVKHLFHLATGGAPLEVRYFGKPERHTYSFAERQLRHITSDGSGGCDAAGTTGSGDGAVGAGFDRIFMVGDNPQADIRGANNAGDPWRSVLVRTGVFGRGHAGPGGEAANDEQDPAHMVVPSIVEAVDAILAHARS